jgi:hypothetical protein
MTISNDTTILFYGLTAAIFVIAIVLVVYWFVTFFRRLQRQYITMNHSQHMDPETQAALQLVCSRMNTAQNALNDI